MLLMSGFLLVYAAIAAAMYLWIGATGVVIVAAIALFMVLSSLFMGDNLAVLVAGGKQVQRKEDAPELWRQVENLAITAGLPMPRLYISNDPSPNAFAAGRNPKQALICVNRGLLEQLDDMELQGVLAHEMSHIRNYDVRLMTYAAVLAGSIALIAQIIINSLFWIGDEDSPNPLAIIAVIATAILAPLAATIIQLAISRRREFVADAAAVELTRYPQGLASALAQISGSMKPTVRDERSIAHMMIAPQLGSSGKSSKLFATHPPTEERIAQLMNMSGAVEHRHDRPVASYYALP